MKEYLDLFAYGATKVVNTIGWHLYDIYYTSVDVSLFGAPDPNILDSDFQELNNKTYQQPQLTHTKRQITKKKYDALSKFIDQQNPSNSQSLQLINSNVSLKGINNKIMMQDDYGTVYVVKPSKKNDEKNYDAWMETLSSDLWKRFMYSRTPTNKHYYDSTYFGVVSPYDKDLTMLRNIGYIYGDNYPHGLEGLASTLLLADFLGDNDVHSQNLMVKEGKIHKLDHGKSFFWCHDDAGDGLSLLDKFQQLIQNRNYQTISFDLKDFKEKLEQINLVEMQELYNIVSRSVYKINILAKARLSKDHYTLTLEGLAKARKILSSEDQNNLNKLFIENIGHQKNIGALLQKINLSLEEFLSASPQINVRNLPSLTEKEYTQLIQIQLENYILSNLYIKKQIYKDLAQKIKALEKIDFLQLVHKERWLEGGWLNVKNDPVLFAHHNNKTIDGKEPFEWALEQNNYKISIETNGTRISVDPVVYAMQNNYRIKNVEPLKYAILHNKTIDGLHPIVYALANGKRIGTKQKHPIQWLIDHNISHIGGGPIADFLTENAIKDGKKLYDINQIRNDLKPNMFMKHLPINIYQQIEAVRKTLKSNKDTLAERGTSSTGKGPKNPKQYIR